MLSTPKFMKAVRFFGPAPGTARVIEEPVPEPGPGQLLVKVSSAGICHTDLELFRFIEEHGLDETWNIRPCHEACGMVVRLGEGTSRFREGDYIGFMPYLGACNACEACAVHPSACPRCRAQGFSGDGFLAEYTVVDEKQSEKLPEGMDSTVVAPIFCAGLTAFHSINKSGVQPGQYIGIVGVGGVGTFAVQFAVKMGFKVVALDINDNQLAQAKELGATTFNTTDPNTKSKVRKLTRGGVHAACVFSGSVKAYESAISVLRLGGSLLVVGVTEPNYLPILSLPITLGFVQVKGINSGRAEEMGEALKFIQNHDIKCLVEKHSIDEYPRLIEQMRAGNVTRGRMVIVF